MGGNAWLVPWLRNRRKAPEVEITIVNTPTQEPPKPVIETVDPFYLQAFVFQSSLNPLDRGGEVTECVTEEEKQVNSANSNYYVDLSYTQRSLCGIGDDKTRYCESIFPASSKENALFQAQESLRKRHCPKSPPE